MDFALTEEQRAFQDTARTFARVEMMPFAREWDENEIFPAATLRKAGFDARYMSGGHFAWKSARGQVRLLE